MQRASEHQSREKIERKITKCEDKLKRLEEFLDASKMEVNNANSDRSADRHRGRVHQLESMIEDTKDTIKHLRDDMTLAEYDCSDEEK
jgi:predicted RNase H-like nuclease (RuvC/YqgF family)